MLKHILIVALVALLVAVGAVVWIGWPDSAQLSVEAVTGWKPQLSRPRDQWIPTMRVPKAVGWPQGQMPTPAAGLKVQPFATGLDHPRWLYTLPNGDVLVAETNSPPRENGGISGWVMGQLMGRAGAGVPSANRITLLRDTNGDGVADVRSVLIGGLNSPFGMALLGDRLYIGDTDALVRVPFHVGDTHVAARPEKVIALPGGGNHWARNVLPSFDGRTLYVTVGSSTNIAEDGIDKEENRANILEVDPQAKTFRVFAGGMRNPNGLAIDARTRRLWAVVNERDLLGSDMTPDYMTAVEIGDFYGWPWSYWGGYVDKRVQPERPDLLQYTKRPDYALGPHVAALGLSFSDGKTLGSRYAYGTFVGEHGSWNRVPVSGYKVIFVPFGPTGFPVKGVHATDVLTGFLDADGNARGRPVGVTLDGKGGLLVADDVGNAVWRVTGR